jgi:hypothetical protein
MPSVSITLPDPGTTQYSGLAVDTSGNIYVGSTVSANPLQGQILIFAAGATGTAAPTQIIPLPTMQDVPGLPTAIAVDSTDNVYVATSNDAGATSSSSVLVFAPDSTAPTRTISISSFLGCGQLAVDTNDNVICALTEARELQLFTSAQSGSATPARSITNQVQETIAMSLDPSGNIWIAQAAEANANLDESLLEFAGGVSGAAAPLTMTPGSALPNSANVQGLGFDTAANLYAYEFGTTVGGMEPPTIARFAAGAGFTLPTYQTLTSFPVLFDPGVTNFLVR